MTRVLYVSPFSAWSAYEHAADDILPQLVPRLAKRCELYFYSPSTGLMHVPAGQDPRPLEEGEPLQSGSYIGRYFANKPSWVREVWPGAATTRTLQHVGRLNPDVVHAEYLQASEPLLRLRTPTTVTLHDASELVTRQLAASGSVPHRAVRYVDALKTRSFERKICSTTTRVMTFSDRDKDFFASRGAQAVRIPMGCSIPEWQWRPMTTRRPPRLIFFGAMWRRANILAVLRLVRDVMPKIWAQLPDVRLSVVGSRPPPEIMILGEHDQRIKITGRVAEPDEWYLSSDVCLAPAEVHGGVLIKLLRGLSLGCPVVTSPVAAGSLRLSDGVQALVANDSDGWASSCLSLIEDTSKALELGQRGRQHVSSNHSWSAMADAYLNEFEQVVTRHV
jgi:glycosyltransferase involved in cell wall biosynthesis